MEKKTACGCVAFTAFFIIIAITGFAIRGCDSGPTSRDTVAPGGEHGAGDVQATAPTDALEIVFVYGSEKEKWIEEVTAIFNSAKHTSTGNKPIWVQALPLGSGETIEEVLAGRLQAHVISPASAAYVVLGNARSRAKTGRDLVGKTENLVLSPVVIAMWKPMAEALGWGQKPVGWADILKLVQEPEGWASLGHPEWGNFKFGHTHPEYSNSGLLSIIAEVYAATGKAADLTLEDVATPETATFLRSIEAGVVHYGSSTGFFGRKMFNKGPRFLSAAVLYENMVAESRTSYTDLPFPVVAIYPKEGTFWSDHPAGIVQRDWVTDEHEDAARQYIDYLLEPEQQAKALKHGFRPADLSIQVTAPLDTGNGVDPAEPKTTIEVPSPEVMNAILELWRKNKKHSNIALVFDTSGSMEGAKIVEARQGAVELIKMLGDEDVISLLPFNTTAVWAAQRVPIKTARQQVSSHINGLFADGGTALYDATAMALEEQQSNPMPGRISAIVVLTDGEDTESQMTLDELMASLQRQSEGDIVRIFTIGYGSEANEDILHGISEATDGKAYEGTTDNIREVFKDIATFF